MRPSRRPRANSACISCPMAPTNLQVQDPGAWVRPPAGHGFPLQGPHAGRRLGDPRFARHRVRRGRPLMAMPPMSFDRATGRLEGATAIERCAALAFAAGAKASAPMHYRGFSVGCRLITSIIDQREIVTFLNDDARFAFPFGDGYWSLLLDRSFVYEGEIERFLRSVADVDYTSSMAAPISVSGRSWYRAAGSAAIRSSPSKPRRPMRQGLRATPNSTMADSRYCDVRSERRPATRFGSVAQSTRPFGSVS